MDVLLRLAVPVGAALATWWLTGVVRQYAFRRRLLDIPNARSSHIVATPRGGGVAIALTTLIALPVLGWMGALPWAHVAGFLGGGGVVAVIGFLDDHAHIARRWRLLAHFGAAAWVVYCLGGLPRLNALGLPLDVGWLGHLLAVVYIVWMLNLTNFMDGIDGIAAIEAVTVSGSAAFLSVLVAPGEALWLTPLVLAMATLGFLPWNWPPAKIFMGDAGSGFLGFMVAALSIQAAWSDPALFWSWVILLGVFVVDATVTLLRRTARGERVYEAHRTHAYQHVAQGRGHQAVTIAVAVINSIWLLPLATLVARDAVEGVAGAVVAYLPLLVAAVLLGAGAPPSHYGRANARI